MSNSTIVRRRSRAALARACTRCRPVREPGPRSFARSVFSRRSADSASRCGIAGFRPVSGLLQPDRHILAPDPTTRPVAPAHHFPYQGLEFSLEPRGRYLLLAGDRSYEQNRDRASGQTGSGPRVADPRMISHVPAWHIHRIPDGFMESESVERTQPSPNRQYGGAVRVTWWRSVRLIPYPRYSPRATDEETREIVPFSAMMIHLAEGTGP